MTGDRASGGPLHGQALLLAGTKASVAPQRLPELVDRAQAALASERDAYRRRYELVDEDERRSIFLVPTGHWRDVGERIGLDRREYDAVRRAHAEHLRRFGSRADRRGEFETALEIREAVVVGAAGDDGRE